MHLKIMIILLSALFLLASIAPSFSAELESRYTRIVYEKDEQLRDFNDGVRLRSLSYLMRNRSGVTVADEVKNKVDVIVERVEAILEMFPRALKFTVVLLSSDREVNRIYKNRYGRKADFIAFYSPGEKTVYISVGDANLHVFAHELAHVIIDHYFGVSPSARIHEVLAQYVEEHLED